MSKQKGQFNLSRWALEHPALTRYLMLVLMLALLCASGMLVGGVLWISRTAMQVEQEASARRLAGLFETSLHSAMLRRDLPGLTEILAHLGGLPGVHFAALLNPGGEVRFASREGDRGSQHPEWVHGLCLTAGCSASPPRLDTLESGATGLLRIAYPIRNQARCSACHGATDIHPVNGVLVIEFTPPNHESRVVAQVRRLLPLGLAALAMLALTIWWVVRREVLTPVGRLAGVAAAVADGDLSARIGGMSGGELGQLGGHSGPARRGVDAGLLDVGQRTAEGREGRALGRAHKALQGVDHFTLRGGPHRPQLDHLHLLGLDGSLIAARRFEVDNEDHATSST